MLLEAKRASHFLISNSKRCLIIWSLGSDAAAIIAIFVRPLLTALFASAIFLLMFFSSAINSFLAAAQDPSVSFRFCSLISILFFLFVITSSFIAMAISLKSLKPAPSKQKSTFSIFSMLIKTAPCSLDKPK
ncbi:hypothetical protein D3C87_1414320 [compost metagenome]